MSAPHACRGKPSTPNAQCHGLGPPSPWLGRNKSWSIISYCARESLAPPSSDSVWRILIRQTRSCALKNLSELRDISPNSPWACPFAHPASSTGPRPSSCQPTNDDDNSPLVVYVGLVPGSTRGHLGSSTKKCAAQKWRAERGWPVCWDLCLSAAATPP